MDDAMLFYGIWYFGTALVLGILALLGFFRARIAGHWKVVELAALVCGGVGVLVPAFEVQRAVYQVDLEMERGVTQAFLDSIIDAAVETMLLNCGRTWTRSDASPPDFDLLVEERSKVCAWSEELEAFVAGMKPGAFVPFGEAWRSNFPDVRDPPVGLTRKALFEHLDEWDARVAHFNEREASAPGGVPTLLFYFSPYLLFAGLALALGEILFRKEPSNRS